MASLKIPGTEVSILPLAKIEVGERFRQDYGDLTELKHSIKTQGLINPITCCLRDGVYLLVAGGRRLEALKQLGEKECLVRTFTREVTDLDLRILELAENLQRKEMTWNESNSLQREIHRLQQEKFGKAQAGGVSNEEKDPDAMGWRLQDTADMLGVSKARVSESIKLADKFDKYSAVLGDPSQYKTENDARKAIKIVEESIVRAELARRAKERGGSLSAKISDSYKVGDVFEGLKGVADQTIYFIECDPPYGIDLDDIKKSGTGEEYHEVSQNEYVKFSKRLLCELHRVLKPNTFCVFWMGVQWIEVLRQLAHEIGFTSYTTPIVWVKGNGQSLSPNTTLASAYEMAHVFRKGASILAKPGRINVFNFSPILAAAKYHPTQKPLPLYQEIYETFSFEGAKCLTPFAGSGASILAAYLSKRECFGWDISSKYKEGFQSEVAKNFLGQ